MPRKRRKARKRKSSFITFSAILRLGLVLILIFIAWAAYLDLQVRQKFDGKKWAIPARVFAQPLEIYEGLSLSPSFLEEALKSLGYKPVLQLQGPGQFTRRGPHYQVFTKGFSFWDKQQPPETYELTLEEGLVTSLSGPEDAFLLRLEPQEIGSIYPGHGEDRILVRLGSIPPLLGETLITVEDKDFANHYGLSLKSIARAALANLKAGNFVQGGSTITQQLVKNFYLTHERSLWRKVQEAMMSVLLELHYSKAEILEAYINEVYMGQSGPRSIHGFSLASQHYFNQPLQNLKPHQVALLVGVVKGASYYNPWNYPERTKSRRDLVLQLMADGGLIDESTRIRSQQLPLGLSQSSPRQQGNYPAYVDLVKRQLLRDYLIEDLQSEGLRIFTNMSVSVQQQAEAAVARQVSRLQQGPNPPLQAAVIVTAVGSGEVLAVVGDKQARFSGFNRALDAQRQIGSLVKPFVYLTALMQPSQYQLGSVINDDPVSLLLSNGDYWRPENFTHKSHGDLLLYQALAFSYNQASARLGLALGVDQVIDTLNRAGLEKAVPAVPALLLGAISLSPAEVSQLYHTLAADGVYTPLRAIRSVLDTRNQPLSRYPLSSEPRFTAEHSHLMHYALQASMRIGTGRRVYDVLPADLIVAGKTGTTNEQRDSWFAGYSSDHLAVVWIGNDDNQPTQLTGSSGALTIWRDIFSQLDTRSIAQATPEAIDYYWIDRQSGLLSSERCDSAEIVPFIRGSEPKERSDSCTVLSDPEGWLRNWFKR